MRFDQTLALIFAAGVGFAGAAAAQAQPVPPKAATAATKAANQQIQQSLPFNDDLDFVDVGRGFIAAPETLTIKNAAGTIIWDMESYNKFIALGKEPADSVNPSLWRNAKLNMQYGLFRVTDRIYQVRGFDLANITFVQGDTGWIVFDPLTSAETAKAAYEFVTSRLGKRPVHTVVYSHTQVDHYGGVRGIVDEADVAAGKVKIIAPENFTEDAVSENVIAGNAMGRRAIYSYGAVLPRNQRGGVSSGLGQTTSTGTVTLIVPTDLVTRTGTEITVDGVKMVFQMTPGTEAPAEMNTYFPQFKAMWMAENSTNTMNNIHDALKWAHWLNETIDLYGKDVVVKFQSHHWPQWSNHRIIDYWKKQRDLYKYTHDQSVNLMNKGYIGSEIAEMIKLPPELENYWPNRGYYGSLRYNSRAVYQRYMGWYDGNPSDLNDLPPEPAARKYVEYMGGEAAVLKRAKADFDKGEYRWVATALKHVVFANPSSKAAKDLLADTYEQLGYQAESGSWRGVYLQGAYELRNGVPSAGGTNTASPDTIKAMPPEMLFDYLAVRLNGPKAAGKKIGLNIDFTDLKKQYGLMVENAVLNYSKPLAEPDAKLTMSKATLDLIQLKETTLEQAILKGDLKVEGRREAFADFMGLLDTFPFWFNIVTP